MTSVSVITTSRMQLASRLLRWLTVWQVCQRRVRGRIRSAAAGRGLAAAQCAEACPRGRQQRRGPGPVPAGPAAAPAPARRQHRAAGRVPGRLQAAPAARQPSGPADWPRTGCSRAHCPQHREVGIHASGYWTLSIGVFLRGLGADHASRCQHERARARSKRLNLDLDESAPVYLHLCRSAIMQQTTLPQPLHAPV